MSVKKPKLIMAETLKTTRSKSSKSNEKDEIMEKLYIAYVTYVLRLYYKYSAMHVCIYKKLAMLPKCLLNDELTLYSELLKKLENAKKEGYSKVCTHTEIINIHSFNIDDIIDALKILIEFFNAVINAVDTSEIDTIVDLFIAGANKENKQKLKKFARFRRASLESLLGIYVC